MTNDEFLAQSFKALSHPRRAMVFRMLTEATDHRISYSGLQHLTGLPDTSLVHHLREMERCGLIARKRVKANVIYTLTPAMLLRMSRLAHMMVTRPALSQVA